MLEEIKKYNIIIPALRTAGIYFFTTDSGIDYEVRFGRRQNNILHANIVFGVVNDEYDGEEYSLTNKGELYRVMATIVEIVKIFMETHPSMLVYEFTAIAKDDEDDDKNTIRINLYKRYLGAIFDNNWAFDYSKPNKVIVSKKIS